MFFCTCQSSSLCTIFAKRLSSSVVQRGFFLPLSVFDDDAEAAALAAGVLPSATSAGVAKFSRAFAVLRRGEVRVEDGRRFEAGSFGLLGFWPARAFEPLLRVATGIVAARKAGAGVRRKDLTPSRQQVFAWNRPQRKDLTNG